MGNKQTKRELMRERRRKAKKRAQIRNILIISGVALIFAAILIWPSVRPIGEIIEPPPREHPMADGKTMGRPEAPVVVEIFEDFQCPACRVFTEDVEPLIIENYVTTGQIHFIFRHFPFIGPESLQAANASMCALEQGEFWVYHDMLFTNQTGENIGAFTDRRLQSFAEILGLDMVAFNECYRSEEYQSVINEEITMVNNLGISGTPSIVVNGQLLPNISYEAIQQAIEIALATSGETE